CRGTRPPRTFSRLRPANTTAPRLGRSLRWINFSRVLLPAPEWPVTNSISPCATSKLTSASASWPPGYCLLTLSNRRTLIAAIMPCSCVLLRPGEGARRADEERSYQIQECRTFRAASLFLPHPALRATFSRREKEQ